MYITEQQKLILRGVSLVTPFPTDDRQTARVNKEIARVAKEMIAEHGNVARVQADHRHKNWELIREVIRDMQESDAKRAMHKSS